MWSTIGQLLLNFLIRNQNNDNRNKNNNVIEVENKEINSHPHSIQITNNFIITVSWTYPWIRYFEVWNLLIEHNVDILWMVEWKKNRESIAMHSLLKFKNFSRAWKLFLNILFSPFQFCYSQGLFVVTVFGVFHNKLGILVFILSNNLDNVPAFYYFSWINTL